jgi:hypothetical protein
LSSDRLHPGYAKCLYTRFHKSACTVEIIPCLIRMDSRPSHLHYFFLHLSPQVLYSNPHSSQPIEHICLPQASSGQNSPSGFSAFHVYYLNYMQPPPFGLAAGARYALVWRLLFWVHSRAYPSPCDLGSSSRIRPLLVTHTQPILWLSRSLCECAVKQRTRWAHRM